MTKINSETWRDKTKDADEAIKLAIPQNGGDFSALFKNAANTDLYKSRLLLAFLLSQHEKGSLPGFMDFKIKFFNGKGGFCSGATYARHRAAAIFVMRQPAEYAEALTRLPERRIRQIMQDFEGLSKYKREKLLKELKEKMGNISHRDALENPSIKGNPAQKREIPEKAPVSLRTASDENCAMEEIPKKTIPDARIPSIEEAKCIQLEFELKPHEETPQSHSETESNDKDDFHPPFFRKPVPYVDDYSNIELTAEERWIREEYDPYKSYSSEIERQKAEDRFCIYNLQVDSGRYSRRIKPKSYERLEWIVTHPDEYQKQLNEELKEKSFMGIIKRFLF